MILNITFSALLMQVITVVTIPNMCTVTHNPEGKATTVKASKVDVNKPVVTNASLFSSYVRCLGPYD